MKIIKKYWWLILIAVIGIALLIYYFLNKPPVKDPNQSNTPVPPGSPTSNWIKETFPLNIGMYGPNIKSLQTWLMKTYGNSILPKYGADGKFGTETKTALTSLNYSVPLSQADYNKIVPTSVIG